MRKSFIAVALIALALGGTSASAQCLTITNGSGPGGITWYMYSLQRACWNTSGNVSNATVSCSTDAGWQIGQVWSPAATIIASFFIPSGKVYNPAHWNIQSRLQTNSPDQSWWDYIDISVSVLHQDGTRTYYNGLQHWNGTMASLSGCPAQTSSYFSASAGETITVTITSANPGGTATLISAVPLLVNYN